MSQPVIAHTSSERVEKNSATFLCSAMMATFLAGSQNLRPTTSHFQSCQPEWQALVTVLALTQTAGRKPRTTALPGCGKTRFQTSGPKARSDNKAVMAALKRCATQNPTFPASCYGSLMVLAVLVVHNVSFVMFVFRNGASSISGPNPAQEVVSATIEALAAATGQGYV